MVGISISLAPAGTLTLDIGMKLVVGEVGAAMLVPVGTGCRAVVVTILDVVTAVGIVLMLLIRHAPLPSCNRTEPPP